VSSTSSSTDLSCQELVELVTMYLEMTLSEAEQARFDAHIAGCGYCTAYLDQMRRTIRLLGTLHEDDIPAEAKSRLLVAFQTWKQGV
jgi:hypothetical protein